LTPASPGRFEAQLHWEFPKRILFRDTCKLFGILRNQSL
jgi:hypothetical protein